FERASGSFDAACAAHDHAREILLNRLEWFDLQPDVIVDAGCGTGRGIAALRRRYPAARILGIDRSAAMLTAAAGRAAGAACLCADVQQLPLPDDSVDLLFANLVLPWCDPLAGLSEFARVLAPDGLLLGSTTGPKTLEQVRHAWRSVDDDVHVHAGVDLQTLGDLLARCGFREPVIDTDRVTLRYSGSAALHAELRSVGALNAAGGRRRSLTGRQRFRAYEHALGSVADASGLDISVEFVFAQAWGGRGRSGEPDAPPSFRGIPLRRG
ncbi:MAG TPA: methyltransferase domain-containing protein, partial [Gammaproteobacteria bacterium]|nr:methyltransferase domain-containing protein [Gammaproteobacteria bacterium]